MAEAVAGPNLAADKTEAESAGAPAPKKRKLLNGKRLVVGGGGLLVVVVGAYMTGMLDPFLGGEKREDSAVEAAAQAQAAVYYDLPDMLVNLSAAGNRPSYLKLSVSLELADNSTVSQLEKLLPRIIDNFQVYLRELRPEDLSGSAGVYRLKEELLARVNTAVYPVVVRDVLFKEMLVQ